MSHRETEAEPRVAVEIEREYGPVPGVEQVNGVTYDGERVWIASGKKLQAVVPETGEATRALDIPADAGTAFDGTYLYQIANGRIQKVDPSTGRVLSTIPAPGLDSSGLAWAEGSLWVGQHRGQKILRINPENGEILSAVTSNRFVTGVSFCNGELWHGATPGVDACSGEREHAPSELRRIDRDTGAVLEALVLPDGVMVSGLEGDGNDRFFCGGGNSGKVRVVKRPSSTARSSSHSKKSNGSK
jgi:hypothetical protein